MTFTIIGSSEKHKEYCLGNWAVMKLLLCFLLMGSGLCLPVCTELVLDCIKTQPLWHSDLKLQLPLSSVCKTHVSVQWNSVIKLPLGSKWMASFYRWSFTAGTFAGIVYTQSVINKDLHSFNFVLGPWKNALQDRWFLMVGFTLYVHDTRAVVTLNTESAKALVVIASIAHEVMVVLNSNQLF